MTYLKHVFEYLDWAKPLISHYFFVTLQAKVFIMNKPRYDILDGLRGVAAVMVLLFHVFNDAKAFFLWPSPVYEFFHGFLAVDFFFILSGFVMGYAYDKQGLSFSNFMKRRLIRLHPMVVMGVLIGLICFVIQGCTKYDGTVVSTEAVMIVTLLGLFMIPSPASLEVRGNTEIFPLNGPQWSLFFEYVGSILYGLLLQKMSTKWLRVWVACSIVSIAGFALLTEDGGIAYGWSSEPVNFFGGALRMLYAYPMGLLMARVFRERQPKPLHGYIFLYCSLALVVLLGLPFVGSKDGETIYQLVCIFSFFPTIIWYGARGIVTGFKQKAVSFLGRLSYPLYIVQYPLVYLYIHWVAKDAHPYEGYAHAWIPALLVIVGSVLIATLCLLFYDEPLRKKLNKKFTVHNS